jgi:hypothetical protein
MTSRRATSALCATALTLFSACAVAADWMDRFLDPQDGYLDMSEYLLEYADRLEPGFSVPASRRLQKRVACRVA